MCSWASTLCLGKSLMVVTMAKVAIMDMVTIEAVIAAHTITVDVITISNPTMKLKDQVRPTYFSCFFFS